MADTSDLMAIQYMNSLPENRRAEFQIAFHSQKKDRTTAFVLSLFLGMLGVDRFYLGQPLLGAIKLVTCGGFLFWALLDLILIWSATDKHNMSALMQLQAAYGGASNQGYPPQGYGPPHGQYPPQGYGSPPGR